MRAKSGWKYWNSIIKKVGSNSAVVVFSIVSALFSSMFTLFTDKTLNSVRFPYLLITSFSASFGIGFGFYLLASIHEHMNIVKALAYNRYKRHGRHFIISTGVFTFGIVIFLFELLYFFLIAIVENNGIDIVDSIILAVFALLFTCFNIYYMGYVENTMEKERR